MKNKKNILLFTSFFIFIILISFCFSIVNIVRAEDIKFTPEVGIPTFKGEQTADGGLLGKFAKELYFYLMGLSGIVAVIILILAGFQWVTAGGNQNKIGEAKERIKNVITGLVLLGSSYLIMYTINPELVKIKVLDIKDLAPEEVRSSSDSLNYLNQLIHDCQGQGGVPYQKGQSSCDCDSSGIKLDYRLDSVYNQDNWHCCICNGCPQGKFSIGNNPNCLSLCESRGCTMGFKYSDNLPNCCVCEGCPQTPLTQDSDCSGRPLYSSCSLDGAQEVGSHKGDPGWCDNNKQCRSCFENGNECEDVKQCKNYSSLPNQYKCGATYVDDTVSCSRTILGLVGAKKCKDTIFD